jgi:hypothetical protein
VTATTPELRGVLASIGIIKGQPFEPTARQQELLKKAVETTPKMILAMRKMGRPDKRHLYYKDRQYERAWAGATAEFMQESYLDVDQRASFFQYAYSSAPAMVMRTIGEGSKYPVTSRDKDGNILNGSHNYKLHLPAGIPAKAFWAVTLYNVIDGSMPETKQIMPSTKTATRKSRRTTTARSTSTSARRNRTASATRTGFRRSMVATSSRSSASTGRTSPSTIRPGNLMMW